MGEAVPPTPAPWSELQLAEEAAASNRQMDEDTNLASLLQAAFTQSADEESQLAPETIRVPGQPAPEAPAGGSLWTYL